MKTSMKFLKVIALAALITFPSTIGAEGIRDNSRVSPQNTPRPFNDISAAELADSIRIGWNLGNTLDTSNLFWLPPSPPVSDMERAWGNPVTTQAHINAIYNAGFNAIRIPVSWAKCADSNYRIREDWMKRVKQVVDYAVNNGMYIILNTHHDEGIFKFTDNEMEESQRAFRTIWEQIAEAFKDYDEKLIFEGLNEPRTIGSPAEWNGGTSQEWNNLNILQQLFVDTVRASGGNNLRRVLMVSSYAASATQSAMEAVKIPHDPANRENKIIVSIHAYEPYNFALNENSPIKIWDRNDPRDTRPIIERIDRAYNLFVSRGIPVIMGEFAAIDKDNLPARVAWAEFYVQYAKSKGIKCFWWDAGGSTILFDRRAGRFKYPEIVDALMRGNR